MADAGGSVASATSAAGVDACGVEAAVGCFSAGCESDPEQAVRDRENAVMQPSAMAAGN